MAISGSFYGTTSNGAIKPRITWSAQANTEGNYSDVTVQLSYSRTDSYQTYGYWSGSLTVDGNSKSVSSKYLEITKNSNTVAITYTLQIPHNDNGSKTVAISASGSISGTTLTKTTISGSVALETIPRAASVSATDADIGSVSMVTLGKKSEAYTYTVAWAFGSLSGFLSEDGITNQLRHVTAPSLAFTLPETFYNEIPDKTSGICTLTCTTYLDETAVGTPQKTTFTVRADPARCGPVLTAAVEDVNETTLALTGNKKRFIRGVSTAKCTMTVQTRFGATVKTRKIAGKTVTSNSLSVVKIGEESIRFSVTDSRGYTAEKTVTLDLIPYAAPTVRLSAARAGATSGNALLQVTGSFYKGSFGSKSNSLKLQYRIGSGSQTTLTPELSGSSYSAQAQLENLTYTNAYTVKVTVSDALSTKTATVRIHPGVPLFDWGKENFAFHVPVAMGENRLTGLADPADERDGVNKQYVDGAFLKNTGAQNLKGRLIAQTVLGIEDTDNTPRLVFMDSAGNTAARVQINAQTHRMAFYQYSPDNSGSRESYQLPVPDQVSQNVIYRILTEKTHGIRKLWENASPTSRFESQTLSLDLNGYDMILCCVRLNTATNTQVPVTLATVGGAGSYSYGLSAGSPVRRTITAGISGVDIQEACKYTSFGSSNVNAANDNLIPTCIYGIKGVS